jgi:hypothetical protein
MTWRTVRSCEALPATCAVSNAPSDVARQSEHQSKTLSSFWECLRIAKVNAQEFDAEALFTRSYCAQRVTASYQFTKI